MSNYNDESCGPGNFKLDTFMDDLVNRSINEIIGTDFISNTPYYNIMDGEDSLKIEIATPGLEKANFSIHIDNHQLVVATKKEEVEAGFTMLRREFDYSGFTKRFDIPEEIDTESISATYANGILAITLLKKEKDGKRVINIV